MTRFRIWGGDGGAYGPEFGPVLAREARIARDRFGDELLLVVLEEPLVCDEQELRQLTLKPRYVGQTLASLRTEGGVVSIGRLGPGGVTDADADADEAVVSDHRGLAIGSCEPVDPSAEAVRWKLIAQ